MIFDITLHMRNKGLYSSEKLKGTHRIYLVTYHEHKPHLFCQNQNLFSLFFN